MERSSLLGFHNYNTGIKDKQGNLIKAIAIVFSTYVNGPSAANILFTVGWDQDTNTHRSFQIGGFGINVKISPSP